MNDQVESKQEPTDEEIEKITNTLKDLSYYIVVKEASDKMIGFILDYLDLVDCWNNIASVENIDARISNLKEEVLYKKSVGASISVMKKIIKRASYIIDGPGRTSNLAGGYLRSFKEVDDARSSADK